VSTYGVVDRQEKVLHSICLANLLPENRAALVDFDVLFRRTLGIPSVRRNANRLHVQNDATAIALAEYMQSEQQSEQDVEGPLLYLRFDEGVNGGIIIGKAPVQSQINVEIGHVYPLLHARDRDFGGVCPVHGPCYEGLASAMTTSRRAAATGAEKRIEIAGIAATPADIKCGGWRFRRNRRCLPAERRCRPVDPRQGRRTKSRI
jgi:predicted NBD/HSP70 family sugar kinase